MTEVRDAPRLADLAGALAAQPAHARRLCRARAARRLQRRVHAQLRHAVEPAPATRPGHTGRDRRPRHGSRRGHRRHRPVRRRGDGAGRRHTGGPARSRPVDRDGRGPRRRVAGRSLQRTARRCRSRATDRRHPRAVHRRPGPGADDRRRAVDRDLRSDDPLDRHQAADRWVADRRARGVRADGSGRRRRAPHRVRQAVGGDRGQPGRSPHGGAPGAPLTHLRVRAVGWAGGHRRGAGVGPLGGVRPVVRRVADRAERDHGGRRRWHTARRWRDQGVPARSPAPS